MNTPVLTKTQQKRSLSGKKKPREKCLRNVLMKPKIFTNPVASEEDSENLIKALGSCINLAESQTSSEVNIKEHNVTKKKGKKDGKQKALLEKSLRKYLCLGINEVARAVENERVLSVVIEKDVDPQFMVSHIGTLCAVHNIPYIIVPNMRSGTHKAFGFACVSLGVKSIASGEDNPFIVFHQSVLETYNSLSFRKLPFELPTHSSLSVSDPQESEEMDTSELSQKDEMVDICENPQLNEISVKDDKHYTDLYLYRSSTEERVFIPNKTEVQTEDYISVGSEPTRPLKNKECGNILKGISAVLSSPSRSSVKKHRRSDIDSHSNDSNVKYMPHEIKSMRPNPDKRTKIKVKKVKTIK